MENRQSDDHQVWEVAEFKQIVEFLIINSRWKCIDIRYYKMSIRSIIRFVLFEWWESKVFFLGRNLFWPLTLSLSLPRVCHYWPVSVTHGADCFVSCDWPTAVSVEQCQGSDRAEAAWATRKHSEYRITLFDNWPNLMKRWGYILTFRRKYWWI